MSFSFKRFHVDDSRCGMKVGTDGVLLGAWASVEGGGRVLDIGCGCGLIALMAAQRNLAASVTGVELDEAAAGDAVKNAVVSPFAERVTIVCADVTAFAEGEGTEGFDHILCNPPYYEEDVLSPVGERALARQTQGGGLTFAALLRCVCRMLRTDDSTFSVVLPRQAVSRFVALAMAHGLNVTRRTDVVTQPGKPAKRSLLEFTRSGKGQVEASELSLVGDDGGRSAAYAQLCADFYL